MSSGFGSDLKNLESCWYLHWSMNDTVEDDKNLERGKMMVADVTWWSRVGVPKFQVGDLG